jgi:N6-L-threonylcarbamoyladenine synthase
MKRCVEKYEYNRINMILSIESSCDDSAIALTSIKNNKLIFHKKISQALEHANYGGVVPELASRLHTQNLPILLKEITDYLKDVKAVAVTNGPGLSVSLLEGVMMAKALSLSLDIPLIAIDHIKGHIFSIFIETKTNFPLLALVVSGGHTLMIEAKSYFDMKIVAKSLDDSAGESFDKVAKMLGFSYPGGPIIEKLALNADEDRFSFPIPLKQKKILAFSYSGIKNSVRLEIQKQQNITKKDKQDIAASFQKTAFLHILDKLELYFSNHYVKNFAVVGGVSANDYFRKKLIQLCEKFDIKASFAKLEFCSDNAAMIGRAGVELYKEKKFTHIDSLDIYSKIKVME